MNKAYGGFYVASIFHVKYIFHFVLSFSLGLSFKFPLQFLICLAAHFISCYQVLLPIPLFMGLFHLCSHGLVYIYFFCWKKRGWRGRLELVSSTWAIPYNRKTYMYMQHYLCMHQKVGKSHPHMDLQLKAHVGWIRDFSFICFFFLVVT